MRRLWSKQLWETPQGGFGKPSFQYFQSKRKHDPKWLWGTPQSGFGEHPKVGQNDHNNIITLIIIIIVSASISISISINITTQNERLAESRRSCPVGDPELGESIPFFQSVNRDA